MSFKYIFFAEEQFNVLQIIIKKGYKEKLVWLRFFQPKNEFFRERTVKKLEKVMGPIKFMVENDFKRIRTKEG